MASQRSHRDADDLAETTPPLDERITWHGVMLAEAYGPSHIGGLLEGLNRLGWDAPRDYWFEHALPEWISRTRARPSGGGFFPLSLHRGTSTSSQSGVYGAPLPNGVDFARGQVLHLTPALTLIVLFFAFEDDVARSVENGLRIPIRSEGRRTANGWTVDTVANRRQDDVVEARMTLRRLAGRFFADHLPGAFSTDLAVEHPACEVVTTSLWDPAELETRTSKEMGYLRTLGIAGSLNVCRSESMDGWTLDLPDSIRGSSSLLLAGNLSRVTGPGTHVNPGPPTSQVSDALFHRFEGLMALWGCTETLRGYGGLLATTRDQLLAQAEGSTANIRRLRGVRRRLLGDAADARTLAEELAGLAAHDDAWRWPDAVTFEPVRNDLWPYASMTELIRSEITRQAKVVSASERRLRADLVADTDAVGAIANLRAQRMVAVMTTLIGLVSAGLVVYQIVTAP